MRQEIVALGAVRPVHTRHAEGAVGDVAVPAELAGAPAGASREPPNGALDPLKTLAKELFHTGQYNRTQEQYSTGQHSVTQEQYNTGQYSTAQYSNEQYTDTPELGTGGVGDPGKGCAVFREDVDAPVLSFLSQPRAVTGALPARAPRDGQEDGGAR